MRSKLGMAALLLLTSCGSGGSGSSSPTPTSTPSISTITFTSSSSASIDEGAAFTIYTIGVSVSGGGPGNATFSLSGTDAAAFQVVSINQLQFKSPPDFEVPTDQNKDNVYELTITASADGQSASLPLRITVLNKSGGRYHFEGAANIFTSEPTAAVYQGLQSSFDQVGSFDVSQRSGVLLRLTAKTAVAAPQPYGDVPSVQGEGGLLGVTRRGATTFVSLTNQDGDLEIRSQDRKLILRIPHRATRKNYGGWIGIGSDGYLYVATGDGGTPNDAPGNAQNKSSLLGKVLRIDVTRDDFPNDPDRNYGIPSDNPFAQTGGAPEVWLYGLRNPSSGNFDASTGDLWLVDHGQDRFEEVNRIRKGASGLNLGWPLFEGDMARTGGNSVGLTMPLLQYGRSDGSSITGGIVYRGKVETLQGLYFFADSVSGNVWSIDSTSLTDGTTLTSDRFTIRNSEFSISGTRIIGITAFLDHPVNGMYMFTRDGSFALLATDAPFD